MINVVLLSVGAIMACFKSSFTFYLHTGKIAYSCYAGSFSYHLNVKSREKCMFTTHVGILDNPDLVDTS
jgi:hypothetical protein